MATFNYTKIAATATRLIAKFGTAVTLTRKNTVDPDPIVGTSPSLSTAEYSTTGLKIKYNENFIEFTEITASDSIVVVNSSVQPYKNDIVTINSEVIGYIQDLKRIQPSTITLCYFLQVRK